MLGNLCFESGQARRAALVLGVWLAIAFTAPCSGQSNRVERPSTPTRAPEVPAPDFSNLESRAVRSIADGRTVVVLIDGKERRVALMGIDEPASEAEHDAARKCLEGLLRGEQVFVLYEAGSEAGTDPAYLYRAPDRLFVNLELIREGFASVAARPKFEHRELFRQYEQRAKQHGRGLWAAEPGSPRTSISTTKPAVAKKEPTKSDNMVCVTRSGKKYHLRSCKHVAGDSQSLTLEDAVAKGYTPCGQCKPPRP